MAIIPVNAFINESRLTHQVGTRRTENCQSDRISVLVSDIFVVTPILLLQPSVIETIKITIDTSSSIFFLRGSSISDHYKMQQVDIRASSTSPCLCYHSKGGVDRFFQPQHRVLQH